MLVDLIFEQKEHLGIITLNRPNAFNALTLPMIKELQLQLLNWASDDTIAIVVIQSNHNKVFCAGGDVRWLYSANYIDQIQFFWHEYRLNHYIHNYPKPYIALLNGITMGGGVGISLHGKYPIISENFIFAMPETSIGFFPDVGSSYLLTRCNNDIGTALGLTGQRINAAESIQCGLIKYIIKYADFNNFIQQLRFININTNINNQIEECIKQFIVKIESFDYDSLFIHKIADSSIAVSNKSPFSVKITTEQLQRAKHLNFTECLMMDYILAKHFMRGMDFYEGVRALLIDKDQKPKWQDDCDEINIMACFEAQEDILLFDL